MTVSTPDADYGELAETLPPSAVSQYLSASSGWVLETRESGVKEVWSLLDNTHSISSTKSGRPRGRILLPLATDFVDYLQRYRDALTALATINGWDAFQLERQVLGIHADLFLVGLDQARADEAIPLRQAEIIIDSIYRMLKATALTTDNPSQRFRGGRLPVPVSSFLEDDVRLGHTRRGSFIFTIASRLDDPAIGAALGETSSRDESMGRPEEPILFSRRVMVNLARGLETTRNLLQGRSSDALNEPAQWGLSVGLIESLEDMTRPEGLRSLVLSFEWASARAKPDVGTEPIRLEHSLVHELPRLRATLLASQEALLQDQEPPLQTSKPPRRETLFGKIVALSRQDETSESSGIGLVTILTEFDGRKRNVRAMLTDQDHRLAIDAYQLDLPVVITGDLIRERRVWWLVRDVQLDADSLRSQLIEQAAPGEESHLRRISGRVEINPDIRTENGPEDT